MRTGNAHDIPFGGACTLQLPLGPRGPKAARRFVVGTMSALKLPSEHIDTAELSISELATNAHLHAEEATTPPEVWIWVRTNPAPELTFSVFDASRACLPLPFTHRPDPVHLLNEHGNGLGIVSALASDTSSHFTRSRLAPTPVKGKATWFTQAIPDSWPGTEHSISDGLAASRLLLALRSRGINSYRRRDSTGLNLITANELIIWVDGKSYFWREGDDFAHHPSIDLHETVERIISRVDTTPQYR
jgi:hypothetical protein